MKSKLLILACICFYTNLIAQTPTEARKIVADIYSLPDEQLFSGKNLVTLGRYVTSKDPAFKLYYPSGKKLDSILGKKDEMKRSSAFIVARVIADEEILPVLNDGKDIFKRGFNDYGGIILAVDQAASMKVQPNWKKLERKISKKFGVENAKRAILWSQIDFYRITKDDQKFVKAYTSFLSELSARIYDLENSVAWDEIFGRINNNKLLLKAAAAYKEVLEKSGQILDSPNFIDTYANLLFKGGKRQEAIEWQQKAVAIATEIREPFILEYKGTLDKMKKENLALQEKQTIK